MRTSTDGKPARTTIIGPAAYVSDVFLLAQQDPVDRRYWHCSVIGRGLNLWALHVVDDHGNLAPVGGWQQ